VASKQINESAEGMATGGKSAIRFEVARDNKVGVVEGNRATWWMWRKGRFNGAKGGVRECRFGSAEDARLSRRGIAGRPGSMKRGASRIRARGARRVGGTRIGWRAAGRSGGMLIWLGRCAARRSLLRLSGRCWRGRASERRATTSTGRGGSPVLASEFSHSGAVSGGSSAALRV